MSKPYPITAFGTRYHSLREAAAAFNLPESTLHARRKGYCDPETALVCNSPVKLIFIGLDGRAYHKVPWSKQPVSTRQIVARFRPDLLAAYDAANPTGEYRPFSKRSESA